MGALMGQTHNTRMANRQSTTGLSTGERRYLAAGLTQAGGKLPLFDAQGQEISRDIIRHCLEKGYAEPWFANPLKPDWLVCRLTPTGRDVVKRV